MKEGPARLNGVEGFGLIRTFRDGALTDSKGHFRAARDEDHFGALFDAFRSRGPSVYEGPVVGVDGQTRRMRVKVGISYISPIEAGSPVSLEGAGSAQVVE